MMAIDAPNLDDRSFDQLLEQARSLIPRYTPEWTDHNETDPGIALLQLHAWLAEQMLYRLNQVPERNYRKFLQLIGIDVKPATPAQVDVTFTTAKADADAIVPARTQVAATSESGPVVFELPQGLVAIGPRLAAVQVYDSIAYRDVTTANAVNGQGIDPFGPHARDGSALLLGFDTPAATFTSQPLTLMLYAEQPLARPVVEVALESAPVPPPATLAYEYWDGSSWEPLQRQLDETWALLRTGRIVVAAPPGRPRKAVVGTVTANLFWLRLRLIEPAFDRVPRLAQVLPNTATALQATTVDEDVLGGSDGMPDQGPFRLSAAPVVALERPVKVRRSDGVEITITALRLEIDEGSGFEPWQEVDDFLASGPDDPHYVLDRAAGEVRFGDGRFGRIPVANAGLPASSIVARSYLAGGGAAGNVGAGSITTLQTTAAGVASVINARAASGGSDEESVADAKRRAPSALKARGRAVTAEDFEALSLEAPAPVARAHALALVHPGFPGIEVPGTVTVIIVPGIPGAAPQPSEATLQLVCRYLNLHRLVTTEVFAVGPTYRQIRISGDIVARGDADLATVRTTLAERVKTWLHALTGGDDAGGWPFGGTIYASSLYRLALDTPGVDRVKDNQLLVELDGARQTFCRDVPIGAGELIEPLEPELRVSYA
ncbi:putative baseplate assembly protein [Solirubrobacter soli]|uniref:putative baseplate assembly protein n=1 Tax=Solirubrobacter soli TaxID=363832 RepID=UPI0004834D84|nr:putative baseplate assembly protein [Solirubrobacter soli]